MNNNDVIITENLPKELLLDKHVTFIAEYSQKKDYEFYITEYLRMSGIYWGLTALYLANNENKINRDDVIEFISKCQHENGGISPSIDHDPHILYTLSAVQILTMYKRLDAIDVEKVISYVSGLQQKDGSFYGDMWGEVDTRFSFCALACLSLLNRLDSINIPKAVDFVLKCQNFEGGFGTRPGSESHAGQIYCCLGALSITNCLDFVDKDNLAWWLCERQLPSGGLNGRPEKKPDVCYSWWVLASLKILNRLDWIDSQKLFKFILASQDEETGGFADRPGDIPDPFHTLFGLAGLSLLGYKGLEEIDPVYCMPTKTILHIRTIKN